jgi:hypothetical protein
MKKLLNFSSIGSKSGTKFSVKSSLQSAIKLNFKNLVPKIKNLLIVDLNSSVVSFYFQEGTSDLSELDFSKLKILESRQPVGLRNNLLFSVEKLQDFLEKEIAIITNSGHRDFKLIFLISQESSDLEKAALAEIAAKFSFFAYQLIERQFFYHQFLMQQKNFSKDKLILMISNNIVELFLFREQKLVFSRITDAFEIQETLDDQLNFLAAKIEDFLFDLSLRKSVGKLKLEYLYVFDEGLLKTDLLDELSRKLKLESIRTKKLC